jgi:hypothetical protein
VTLNSAAIIPDRSPIRQFYPESVVGTSRERRSHACRNLSGSIPWLPYSSSGNLGLYLKGDPCSKNKNSHSKQGPKCTARDPCSPVAPVTLLHSIVPPFAFGDVVLANAKNAFSVSEHFHISERPVTRLFIIPKPKNSGDSLQIHWPCCPTSIPTNSPALC